MVKPNIEKRYNNPIGIQTKINKKLAEVLGKEVVARYEKPTLEDQGKGMECVQKKFLVMKTTRQRKKS